MYSSSYYPQKRRYHSSYSKKRIYGSAYQKGLTTKYQRYGRTVPLDPGYVSIPRSLPTRQSQIAQVEELRKAGLIPPGPVPQTYNYNIEGEYILPEDQYMAQGSTFTAVCPFPQLNYAKIQIPANNTDDLNTVLKNNIPQGVQNNKVVGFTVTAKAHTTGSGKYLFIGCSQPNDGTGFLYKITDTSSNNIINLLASYNFLVSWDGTDFIINRLDLNVVTSGTSNSSYPLQIRTIQTSVELGYHPFFGSYEIMGTSVNCRWDTINRQTVSSWGYLSNTPVNMYICRGTLDESQQSWTLPNWTSKNEYNLLVNSADSALTWDNTQLSLDIILIYRN